MWNRRKLRSQRWFLSFLSFFEGSTFRPNLESEKKPEANQIKKIKKKNYRERVVEGEERSVRSLNTIWVRYGRVRMLRSRAPLLIIGLFPSLVFLIRLRCFFTLLVQYC